MRITNEDLEFLEQTFDLALFSVALRKKVACLIVDYTNNLPKIISTGVNTNPFGFFCENIDGSTSKTSLCAEFNALNRVKTDYYLYNCTIYINFQPCIRCSEIILSRGIMRVVFCLKYKNNDGIKLLKEHGVEVVEIPLNFLSKTIDLQVIDYSGYLRRLYKDENIINSKIVLSMITGVLND